MKLRFPYCRAPLGSITIQARVPIKGDRYGTRRLWLYVVGEGSRRLTDDRGMDVMSLGGRWTDPGKAGINVSLWD